MSPEASAEKLRAEPMQNLASDFQTVTCTEPEVSETATLRPSSALLDYASLLCGSLSKVGPTSPEEYAFFFFFRAPLSSS